MDDITAKITELLSDPSGMESIMSLASQFMPTQSSNNTNGNSTSGNSTSSNNNSESEQSSSSSTGDSGFNLGPEQMSSLMSAFSIFNQNKDDDSTRLLYALKPHLSEERQKKVDNAARLMKLVKMLPYLQDSGLMNLFG